MDAGNVLDNSQPQTGAAGGLAPALIHSVEAFEYAGLRVFRDTDAVILDGQGTMAALFTLLMASAAFRFAKEFVATFKYPSSSSTLNEEKKLSF